MHNHSLKWHFLALKHLVLAEKNIPKTPSGFSLIPIFQPCSQMDVNPEDIAKLIQIEKLMYESGASPQDIAMFF